MSLPDLSALSPIKTNTWCVCVEKNHPKTDKMWREHHHVITFVPKDYWDAKKEIRPSNKTTKEEWEFIDQNLQMLGLQWNRKADHGSFHMKVNTVGEMQCECYVPGSIAEDQSAEALARHFIQLGFNYNRYLTEECPLRGEAALPSPITTDDCVWSLRRWLILQGGKAIIENLLPEYARKGCDDRVWNDSYWKQRKKSKTERTFEFCYHPDLKAKVTTDEFTVTSVVPYYESSTPDVDENFYKAEAESDQKYIDFVRENLNKVPTKKDFQIVAAAVNLTLTLPPGHGTTSVIKTLRGKAVATKKRPEFGIAKNYKGVHIEQLAWNLHNWLEERDILKYKRPPDPKSGNYEDYAPSHIKFRDVSPMEIVLLVEHYSVLGEKYGR